MFTQEVVLADDVGREGIRIIKKMGGSEFKLCTSAVLSFSHKRINAVCVLLWDLTPKMKDTDLGFGVPGLTPAVNHKRHRILTWQE